jgi:hypothetical protein
MSRWCYVPHGDPVSLQCTCDPRCQSAHDKERPQKRTEGLLLSKVQQWVICKLRARVLQDLAKDHLPMIMPNGKIGDQAEESTVLSFSVVDCNELASVP